jgi:cytoskeletal protein RodZ
LKVAGENTPSHEELKQIIDKTSPYVESSKSNYTYISNINAVTDTTNDVEENIIKKTNSSKKKKKMSEKPSSKNKQSEKLSSKNKKKSNSLAIIIIVIIIIIICLIGIIFFYKKYFKEKENAQLAKQLSDSSYESQISTTSNKSDSIKSQNGLPPSVVKQLHSKKQKPGRQAATNWFKLDEDI